MQVFHLIAIAAGLSADSFAVAATEGVLLKGSRHAHSLRVALVFGLCQGAMPLLGWLAGHAIYDRIQPVAEPAAFFILAAIGIKMIYSTLRNGYQKPRSHSLGLRLWALGIAVSIDALGIGITLAIMGFHMWTAALVIGLITAFSSVLAVQMGARIGVKIRAKAELAGGLVLIIIAFSFLL